MKHNQKKTLQRKSLVSHGARVVITRAQFLTVTELEMKTACKRKRHNLEGDRLERLDCSRTNNAFQTGEDSPRI